MAIPNARSDGSKDKRLPLREYFQTFVIRTLSILGEAIGARMISDDVSKNPIASPLQHEQSFPSVVILNAVCDGGQGQYP